MTTNAKPTSWWTSPPGLLLLASALSSAVAWWMIAAPVALFANVPRHAGHFPLVYVHMLGGTVMLLFGAANLYIGTTRRHFRHHRTVGMTYLIGGAIGAITAIVATLSPAHKSNPDIVLTNATVSLTMLALSWLGAAAMAYRAARNRRHETHRDWVIRSYVLAWSFVFCRVASRVTDIEELGNGEAFIWLSWVAPLLLCEATLQWRAGARQTRRWHATVDGCNHTLELTAARIRLSIDEGTPESYGGRDLTYAAFLRSEKWQRQVRDIFGDDVLGHVRRLAEARVDP